MPKDSPQTVSHGTLRQNVPEKKSFEGRLLQIHPLNLNAGLIELESGEFVIGREPECSLVIDEQAVSRHHAKIERVENRYSITDLDSTNGTWVNQRTVKFQLLNSGDRIRIGSRIFKFIATDEIEAQYHDAVYAMMTRDSLTGTWNKRYFFEMLDRELKRRQRSRNPLSLIMIDLDRFKKINDTHGHAVGDEVLVEFSNRIRTLIRAEDIFARYGGEEFVIILSDTASDEALLVGERWRHAIEQTPFTTAVGPVKCTISLGLAVASEERPFVSSAELVKLADEMLYQSKENGRNRISF
jgi:diguanylate cyclase (GGDEF)-like protein